MNIFIGSLAFSVKDDRLKEVFEQFGEVTEARVITDKFSGRSKGYGFVDMPDAEAAKKAIETLNGNEIDGRPVVVNEARPREERERPARNYRG